jgi:hypothetical protein
VSFDQTWTVVQDCRNLFPPLTTLSAPGVHVLSVGTPGGGLSPDAAPLHNDGVITPAQLAAGIEIVCDKAVQPLTLAGKPTCLVTLELPFPATAADKQLWGNTLVGTVPVTLASVVKVSGPTIHWEPAPETKTWLSGQDGQPGQLFVAAIHDLGIAQPRFLVSLRVRGNFIYEAGNPAANLDGEAFGLLRATGLGPLALPGTLDVQLPSGDGHRGGDLVMWFWLEAPAGAEPPHV